MLLTLNDNCRKLLETGATTPMWGRPSRATRKPFWLRIDDPKMRCMFSKVEEYLDPTLTDKRSRTFYELTLEARRLLGLLPGTGDNSPNGTVQA